MVTGGAGTGKTRLASTWARRALSREERVLFVCFNEPLADDIAERLLDDENLVTGAFYQVALRLDGMPHLDIPLELDDAERKLFWDVTASGHLHANWPLISDSFDTIIIDEAQDFSPAWIAQLAALLDTDGPRRMLMVADAGQDVFNRGSVRSDRRDGRSGVVCRDQPCSDSSRGVRPRVTRSPTRTKKLARLNPIFK